MIGFIKCILFKMSLQGKMGNLAAKIKLIIKNQIREMDIKIKEH